jgi:hypothetical protein
MAPSFCPAVVHEFEVRLARYKVDYLPPLMDDPHLRGELTSYSLIAPTPPRHCVLSTNPLLFAEMHMHRPVADVQGHHRTLKSRMSSLANGDGRQGGRGVQAFGGGAWAGGLLGSGRAWEVGGREGWDVMPGGKGLPSMSSHQPTKLLPIHYPSNSLPHIGNPHHQGAG